MTNKSLSRIKVGMKVRLLPHPIHIAESGEESRPTDDDWEVESCIPTLVVLKHSRTKLEFRVPSDQIRELHRDSAGTDQLSLWVQPSIETRGAFVNRRDLTDDELYSELCTRERKDALLWHYTTWSGLHGILKKKKDKPRELWASHIEYLNDALESRYGEKLIGDAIRRSGHDALLDMWNIRPVTQRLPESDPYVISFSRRPDSLGQWRAYSTPGSGFALGFDGEAMERLASSYGFKIMECKYEKDDQEKLVNEVISALDAARARAEAEQAAPQTYNAVPWKGYRMEQDRAASYRLPRLALQMKHKSFEEEDEIRLVSELHGIQRLQMDFHPKGALVVPHVGFPIELEDNAREDLDSFPVKGILVGPGPHRELVVRAIRQFVKVEGLTNIPVVGSQTPFRSW